MAVFTFTPSPPIVENVSKITGSSNEDGFVVGMGSANIMEETQTAQKDEISKLIEIIVEPFYTRSASPRSAASRIRSQEVPVKAPTSPSPKSASRSREVASPSPKYASRSPKTPVKTAASPSPKSASRSPKTPVQAVVNKRLSSLSASRSPKTPVQAVVNKRLSSPSASRSPKTPVQAMQAINKRLSSSPSSIRRTASRSPRLQSRIFI